MFVCPELAAFLESAANGEAPEAPKRLNWKRASDVTWEGSVPGPTNTPTSS